MKTLTLIFISVALAVGTLSAQTRQVSGVVTDAADGEPLPGVSVTVKGSRSATATDVNGRYTISVAGEAVLLFSFIGMKTQEEAVAGRPTINMALHTEAKRLDDVVLVAYGTAKKGAYTGAVAVVGSTEKLKDIPVLSFENALQGAAAGVQVGTISGQPGALTQIRIRGTGSFQASNEPLYVIDGIPSNSGEADMASYGGSLSVMSTLNPSDIENITILKDAAATSLYGSRGANGVILVTTKKGQQGLKINFKGSWGINDWAMRSRPYLDGDQTRMLTLEGAYNQAIYNGLPENDARAYSIVEADKYAPARNEYSDWEGALFRNNGTNNAYEVSATGGSDKMTFYVSLGARDALGMANNSTFKSYTGKANMAYRGDKWKIDANISLAKIDQLYMTGGGTYYENFYYMTRSHYAPNIPIYNEDGSFYEGAMLNSVPNKVKDKFLVKDSNALFKSTNNLSFAYELFRGLQLKETLSYDYTLTKSIAMWPLNSHDGKIYNGTTQIDDTMNGRVYSSLLLTYDRSFAGSHTLNALLGWDVDDNPSNYLYASARNYAVATLWELIAAAEPDGANSNHYDDRTVSYFGRLNYSYKDRYYAAATYRRDGSSRLGANTRWGDFWSASASWRVKEEAFLREVDVIDDLKIRVSYGITGTLPSSLYGSLATYSYAPAYNEQPASAPSLLANPDLSWERNRTFDAGLEARLLDRVSLELDFYNRQTNDMLLTVPISSVTGFGSTTLNYGGMNNRGVELSLGVDILKRNGFFWTTTLLAAHNRNRITRLYDGKEFVSGTFIVREGEPVYSFYGREWAGVDPGTGDPMWYAYETGADGKLTEVKHVTKDPDAATRKILTKADPFLTGGWRNSFEWNGIDLDVLCSFSLGGHSYDGVGWAMNSDGYLPGRVISTRQLDRWQKPGDVAQFPRRMHGGGYGNHLSDRMIHSTNHLRLKTVTLGYSLPQKWVKKASVQNARLFVAGNNLLTWAAYKEYDPELSIAGNTSWDLPALRSVSFGVELAF
jgi:TonB-linked SusC/RagA family outer membrane protein